MSSSDDDDDIIYYNIFFCFFQTATMLWNSYIFKEVSNRDLLSKFLFKQSLLEFHDIYASVPQGKTNKIHAQNSQCTHALPNILNRKKKKKSLFTLNPHKHIYMMMLITQWMKIVFVRKYN